MGVEGGWHITLYIPRIYFPLGGDTLGYPPPWICLPPNIMFNYVHRNQLNSLNIKQLQTITSSVKKGLNWMLQMKCRWTSSYDGLVS